MRIAESNFNSYVKKIKMKMYLKKILTLTQILLLHNNNIKHSTQYNIPYLCIIIVSLMNPSEK